ncbi:hypothetical protein NIES2107_65210 [Nostoc carneum NIES-2107]|nr:hypothetical protein NIES2107_65210 [Nostoc carneum NIES-2107]
MLRNSNLSQSVLDNALILVEILLKISTQQQSDNLLLKPTTYVYWKSTNELRVTGWTQNRKTYDEKGTKLEYLLQLIEDEGKKLTPHKKRDGSDGKPKEALQIALDFLFRLGVRKEPPKSPGFNHGWWKFTLILENQTKTTEENLQVIKQKWNEYLKTTKPNKKQNQKTIANPNTRDSFQYPEQNSTSNKINEDNFLPEGFETLKKIFLAKEGKRSEGRLLKIAEANWSLIINKNYIERDNQQQWLQIAKDLAEFEGISLLLIKGNPGAGKTAVMYWLAHQLFEEDHLIIVPTNKRNEVDSGWLEQLYKFSDRHQEKHFYIIVDDIFRNSSILEDLKQVEYKFPLTLIATTRINENQENYFGKSGDLRIETVDIGKPSEREKDRIIEKIREDKNGAERLSKIEETKLQELRQHDVEMLVFMLELSEGKGFDQIIADVIQQLNNVNQTVYKVYEVICTFGQYNIHLAEEIIALLLPNTSIVDVNTIVQGTENSYLSGLINRFFTRYEYYAFITIHELIAYHTIQSAYSQRNPFYNPTSIENYLKISLQNFNINYTSHIRWISYCLKSLANQKDKTHFLKDILRQYEKQIQDLQEGATVATLYSWFEIYKKLEIIEDQNKCKDKILNTSPKSGPDWFYWLSVIDKFGDIQQKLDAVIKITHVLQHNSTLFEKGKDQGWRIRKIHLKLIRENKLVEEKLLSQDDFQQVIKMTVKWLSRKDDWQVRKYYLLLISKNGNTEQQQEAIINTNKFLNNYPKYWVNNSVLHPYLELVKRKGYQQDKQEAISKILEVSKENHKFFENLLQAFLVGFFLAIINDAGTHQQKQEVIQKIGSVVNDNPEIYSKIYDLPDYLNLISKENNLIQTRKAIDNFPKNSELQSDRERINKGFKLINMILKNNNEQHTQIVINSLSSWLDKNYKEQTYPIVIQKYLLFLKKNKNIDLLQKYVKVAVNWVKSYQKPENNNDNENLARLLIEIGETYYVLKRWNVAEKYHGDSYDISQQIPDEKIRLKQMSVALSNRAKVVIEQGIKRYGDACDYLEKSTQIAEQIGDTKQIEINNEIMNKIR